MTEAKAREANARLAATLLLVRNGKTGLEVFMMLRHKQFDFASAPMSFPAARWSLR